MTNQPVTRLRATAATSVLLLTGLLAPALSAATTADLSYTIHNDQVTITNCKATARGHLEIPAAIGNKPVTAIKARAFACCVQLTSVTVPDSVVQIGDAAFQACYSLREITLPDTLTSIAPTTFDRCYTLSSVTIPESVSHIGRHAFRDCRRLTAVTIPASVTAIDAAAFESCIRLRHCTFNGSAPVLGSHVFANVSLVATAIVPAAHAESYGGPGSTFSGLWVSPGKTATGRSLTVSTSALAIMP